MLLKGAFNGHWCLPGANQPPPLSAQGVSPLNKFSAVGDTTKASYNRINSMSDAFFDSISGKDLFSNPNVALSQHINAAEAEARQTLQAGEYIRQSHRHGKSNTSLESTAAGAQRVAQQLARTTNLGQRKERLFGEHIRETVDALKLLWRK